MSILINDKSVVKICDFGSAKLLDDKLNTPYIAKKDWRVPTGTISCILLIMGNRIIKALTYKTLLEETKILKAADFDVWWNNIKVNEIEFVISSGEDLFNDKGVGYHADGSHDLGEITTWNKIG